MAVAAPVRTPPPVREKVAEDLTHRGLQDSDTPGVCHLYENSTTTLCGELLRNVRLAMPVKGCRQAKSTRCEACGKTRCPQCRDNV